MAKPEGNPRMACINWGEHYSVGVPVMDRQHKRLADIVNQLQTDLRAGAELERLALLLSALSQEIQTHFAEEEKLMESIGFPGATDHVQKHLELSRRLADLQERFLAGDKPSVNEVMVFFRDWFVDHIQKDDRDYGVFIYNQRAKLRADASNREKMKEPVV